jgi:hypothetical protein
MRQTARLLRRPLDIVDLDQLPRQDGELVVREDDSNRRYWEIRFPVEDCKY